MNILHHACSLNHPKVLNYFIKKLVPDVIARLVLQKTYNDEETVSDCFYLQGSTFDKDP